MDTDKKQSDSGADLVEVVDHSGRPLAVVAAAEAHRQSLPHRAVLVLFFDRQGRLILTKRSKDAGLFAGRWELPARDHIRPGEATEDTARRLAEALFPRQGGVPILQASLPAGESTDYEALTVFRYNVTCDDRSAELLQASREELDALADEYRELFTPSAIYALKQGILFLQEVAKEIKAVVEELH